ncbi:GntR family transcriptional regulator [Paenibacillus xanthanilyticus]|uniref:GntR family transcriptional regulator n=1 Tax=Paenibacillus xanthanilyticus TaxID=1783531 RepID=A0ABV8K0U3_9BACL
MNRELSLKVDSQLSFSVNIQVKEQLKWLIGIGLIQPGDMLPAANQLADALGINRNTVNLVYTQLRDEGVLNIQKGRGTQVVSGPVVAKLREKRRPMHELLARTIEEARSQGIALEEFFLASLAYTLLSTDQPQEGRHIALVECREHDHLFYRDEIARITGKAVRTVFVEDLRSGREAVTESIGRAGLVIATLNHADEVKAMLAPFDIPVEVIGATLDPAGLLQLARLEAGTRVGFACLGRSGGQWMATRVEEAGITQIVPSVLEAREKAFPADMLADADLVYASAAVYDQLLKAIPEKVRLYPMQLERSSQRLLEELAKASGESR